MSKKRTEKRDRKVAREPRKEMAQKDPQVVFAFRLSEADRTLIHEAAGRGKATRFVQSAALAAATGNPKAFEELTTQAKANRK